MKNFLPDDSNDSLSKVLREWKVSAPLPPRFEEQVWQRIARSEAAAKSSLWKQLSNWLDFVLPRPAVAASYLSVLLLAGVATGYWRGHERAAHLQQEMSSRYLLSVNPYQTLLASK